MNIWHLTEKMVNHLEPSIPAHLVAGSHEITTSGRSYLRSILRGSAPGPGSAIPWHGAEVVSPRVRLPSLPDDNQPPPDSQDADQEQHQNVQAQDSVSLDCQVGDAARVPDPDRDEHNEPEGEIHEVAQQVGGGHDGLGDQREGTDREREPEDQVGQGLDSWLGRKDRHERVRRTPALSFLLSDRRTCPRLPRPREPLNSDLLFERLAWPRRSPAPPAARSRTSGRRRGGTTCSPRRWSTSNCWARRPRTRPTNSSDAWPRSRSRT